MKEGFYNLLTDAILCGACLFILAGGVYISLKTRFVQLRSIPFLWRNIKKSFFKKEEPDGGIHTLSSGRALFTAMSTTLGMSTIVGPMIAIQLGGPAALLGFLFTSFLGGAVTYVEVCLGVTYRLRSASGKVAGGPMQYLRALFSKKLAKIYAIGCMLLMMGWSAAQANQFAAVLDSPVFGPLRIDPLYSGAALVLFIILILLGGVKRIGSFSAKVVPLMFLLYVGSSLWIVLMNLDRTGEIFGTIFGSLFSPRAFGGGALVGGFFSACRWGILKGVQATEAGVGTQTIPHSFAETSDPKHQGLLAMLSTFCAGSLAFLSGWVALITDAWQDPSRSLGIATVMASYEEYFSLPGALIIAFSGLLFGLGTILGNAFNGEQCYEYLTGNKNKAYYLFATGLMIFLGAAGEVKTVWSSVDILLALIAVPHMTALFLCVRRSPERFSVELNPVQQE